MGSHGKVIREMVRLLCQNGSSHEDEDWVPAGSDLGDTWHRESKWNGDGGAFEGGGVSAQHKEC